MKTMGNDLKFSISALKELKEKRELPTKGDKYFNSNQMVLFPSHFNEDLMDFEEGGILQETNVKTKDCTDDSFLFNSSSFSPLQSKFESPASIQNTKVKKYSYERLNSWKASPVLNNQEKGKFHFLYNLN